MLFSRARCQGTLRAQQLTTLRTRTAPCPLISPRAQATAPQPNARRTRAFPTSAAFAQMQTNAPSTSRPTLVVESVRFRTVL